MLLPVSLQACRGGDLDNGVEVDSATDASTACDFQQYLSVPMDTVVMYATAPGEPDSLIFLVICVTFPHWRWKITIGEPANLHLSCLVVRAVLPQRQTYSEV